MKYAEYFDDRVKLDEHIGFYVEKKQLIKIDENKALVHAHLAKAKHNLAFFELNKNNNIFTDWLIVVLYYTLYHCVLALVVHKRYTSKNHTATLLFIIKEYALEQDDIELLEELSISKDDAQMYTDLMRDRHHASYTTNFLYSKEKVQDYRFKVVQFMEKVKRLITI